jgi:CDP-glycerol glycerophosphotransferase
MSVKKLAYLCSLPLLWALYAFSRVVPRRPLRVAFGSLQDQFSENSRYLFLSLGKSDGTKRLEQAWITGNPDLVRSLRARGFVAYHRWSPKGLAYALTAGTYVTSSYLSDVNFWCSGRCRHVSLWHGIPLKKIERDITVGPLAAQFRPGLGSLLAHAAVPQKFRKPDYLVSPSLYSDEVFQRAFGVPRDAIIRSIYPRSAFLAEKRRADVTADAPRTLLFCPTWRDQSDERDIAMLQFCIATLDQQCRAQGFRLLVKLHPNVAKRPDMSTVVGERGLACDLYEALASASLVLTDYSSILFECIFAGIPMMLHSYDGERYEQSSRDLYFQPKQLLGEVWRDRIEELDIERQIAVGTSHLARYRARFGFHQDDRVTPLLLPEGANGALSGRATESKPAC